jgi:hypothetical protein
MTYLQSLHIEGQALQALMKERKDLIQVKTEQSSYLFVYTLQ